MKKIATILFLFNFACLLSAQTMSLESFNEQRLRTNKKAMVVLGGWAVGNIAVGSIMMGQKEGKGKYFHRMNAGWGAVNLGIATLAYLSSNKTAPGDFDTFQTIQEQYNMQKILLFNAGLDMAYMAGGAYLIERSKNSKKNTDRLRGFGESIILQGAFLFAFDASLYLVHRANNESLQFLLDGLSFQGNGIGWRMVF